MRPQRLQPLEGDHGEVAKVDDFGRHCGFIDCSVDFDAVPLAVHVVARVKLIAVADVRVGQGPEVSIPRVAVERIQLRLEALELCRILPGLDLKDVILIKKAQYGSDMKSLTAIL